MREEAEAITGRPTPRKVLLSVDAIALICDLLAEAMLERRDLTTFGLDEAELAVKLLERVTDERERLEAAGRIYDVTKGSR